VTILRDGRTIGTSSPFPVQRRVRFPFRDLHITPPEKPLGVDAVEVLVEERERS
jgi:hypothetical protein